jgi:phosphoribosylglycinamide formyltransferase-1
LPAVLVRILKILSNKVFPITFLFTDKRDAKALARAEKLGIQSHTFALKEFEDKAAYETELLNLLAQYDIDLIVLAGYMKIVSPTLLQAYEGRIINIHPAYLPEFPGAHGIEDAWRAGVTESGVTIHYVDAGVDTGQIIAQRRVPVLPDDTLETFEARVHEMEYVLYPEVLKAILNQS